jgi:hypothetical protein
MDEDIDSLEFLKQLLSTPEMLMYYFHYDPSNGKIINLRNYLEVDEYPYLKFPQTDFNSEISIDDYQIIDNDGTKQLVKQKSIETISKIDDKVYQINKKLVDPNIKISQTNYYFDVLIEQDNIKKEFRIRLSGALKDQYHQDLNSKNHNVFYVTAENDPNILYKTLDVPLAKLLQYYYYTIPYDNFTEFSCNIFSMRYFNNYLHLVIE